MLQKITKTQRLVCFALAATVVFQVPMMKIGSDKARPFTPVSVVASQLALPIPDAPGKPGDPGDLLRAIMYPGELVWGAWDAYVCATSAEACAEEKASWTPDWNTFLKVSELKGSTDVSPASSARRSPRSSPVPSSPSVPRSKR